MKRGICYLLAILLIASFLVSGCGPKVTPTTVVTGEWEEILAAAKTEGEVQVMSAPGDAMRDAVMEFEKAYPGIKVKLWQGRGSALTERITTERAAGIYNVDVILYAGNRLWRTLKEFLTPVEPVLILPEVTNQDNWQTPTGETGFYFADIEGKYCLSYGFFAHDTLQLNSDKVDPEIFKSIEDILRPEFKGKIALTDATKVGQGRTVATWLAYALGNDGVVEFYKKLKAQEPMITADPGQLADWVAHGTYPIGMSASATMMLPYIKEGLPIALVAHFKEGAAGASGYGSLALPSNAPHPNAAKVLANWVLGKEGQHFLCIAVEKASLRKDVPPPEILATECLPRPGFYYLDTIHEANAGFTSVGEAAWKEVFGE